jgi:hypothetical protein
MDYSGILQNVSKHISLEKEEISYFTSLLKKKEIRRKELMLKEGQPCTTINCSWSVLSPTTTDVRY